MENVGVLQGGIEAVQSVCAKVKNLRKIKGGFTMFQVLKKRIKNEKGLSLVELLAVIVILGIVAAIAVPSIGNIINNQRDKAVLAELSNAISSAKIAYVDGVCKDEGEGTCEEDDLEFTATKFKLTSVSGLKTNNPKITFADAEFSEKGEKFKLTGTEIEEKDLNNAMQNGVTATP